VIDKNRLGPSRTITVRADFEEGRFEMTEAPYAGMMNSPGSKKLEPIPESLRMPFSSRLAIPRRPTAETGHRNALHSRKRQIRSNAVPNA
jgi:hypothetical protein